MSPNPKEAGVPGLRKKTKTSPREMIQMVAASQRGQAVLGCVC